MNRILWPGEAGRAGPAVGGKASGLASLTLAGMPVPAWFVVTGTVSAEELESARATLCPNGELVAVRSSALDEDGGRHSFAGQMESHLFVPPCDVAVRLAAVRASVESPRAASYRRHHRLGAPPDPMPVIVQRMVEAEFSGVAFSADPVTGRRGVAVVAAARGVGEALVGGVLDGETYRVDRDGRFVSRPANSELGVERARQVALLARQAERLFGRPQDIEWAFAGGALWVLQSRPVTNLATVTDPDGLRTIWDNSNIVESFPGIVSPLTFSFARRAYEEVYRQFCRVMRVPEAVVELNAGVFRQMLGLIRGRVYYNLLSWYRVLTLLPAYTANRVYFEQMLGVQNSLPGEHASELAARKPAVARRLGAAVRTLAGVAWNYLSLARRCRAFRCRLDEAFASQPADYAPLRADELCDCYRDLERKLLTRWDAPIVNDFFCMIFHGLLRKLLLKWCGQPLDNDLLVAGGGLASARPAELLSRLGETAASDPALLRLLESGELTDILPALPGFPEFERLYRQYLDQFGDRCLEELKLESPTLNDDPLPLLRSAASAACCRTRGNSAGAALRAGAERKMSAALKYHPLRKVALEWVLFNARARIRGREELRFERTRVFGRARRIFTELGRRLYALDLLDQPGDVFYLEVEEVLGFIAGTATSTNLRCLVESRKAEYEDFRRTAAPAGRFETLGIVNQGNSFQAATGREASAGSRRKGIGCCRGIVRGRVRVITDPRRETPQPGEIVVAQRTDPGWILIFPSAAGLIVECGSLLSHTAIVAREMGIPAVVSLAGVTEWLQTGDSVELDGASGEVIKVSHVERCA